MYLIIHFSRLLILPIQYNQYHSSPNFFFWFCLRVVLYYGSEEEAGPSVCVRIRQGKVGGLFTLTEGCYDKKAVRLLSIHNMWELTTHTSSTTTTLNSSSSVCGSIFPGTSYGLTFGHLDSKYLKKYHQICQVCLCIVTVCFEEKISDPCLFCLSLFVNRRARSSDLTDIIKHYLLHTLGQQI